MIRGKMSLLVPIGLLMVSSGVALNVVHGTYAHFLAGFLLGAGIVLEIAGLVRMKKAGLKK